MSGNRQFPQLLHKGNRTGEICVHPRPRLTIAVTHIMLSIDTISIFFLSRVLDTPVVPSLGELSPRRGALSNPPCTRHQIHHGPRESENSLSLQLVPRTKYPNVSTGSMPVAGSSWWLLVGGARASFGESGSRPNPVAQREAKPKPEQ